jgi:hypothetical protein
MDLLSRLHDVIKITSCDDHIDPVSTEVPRLTLTRPAKYAVASLGCVKARGGASRAAYSGRCMRVRTINCLVTAGGNTTFQREEIGSAIAVLA